MRWLGKLFVGGIFDGEHYFLLEPIDENRTRILDGENFSGLLVGPLSGMLVATREGFRGNERPKAVGGKQALIARLGVRVRPAISILTPHAVRRPPGFQFDDVSLGILHIDRGSLAFGAIARGGFPHLDAIRRGPELDKADVVPAPLNPAAKNVAIESQHLFEVRDAEHKMIYLPDRIMASFQPSDRLRIADLTENEIALGYAQSWPCRAPSSEMCGQHRDQSRLIMISGHSENYTTLTDATPCHPRLDLGGGARAACFRTPGDEERPRTTT